MTSSPDVSGLPDREIPFTDGYTALGEHET
jgi:hypothetical protein